MRSPEYSTPEIYSTMLACWEANPSDRPTFTSLVETLGDLLEARVQQDGKDYIPLGTFLCEERDSTESSLTDLHPHRLISLGYMNTRSTATLRTFEELPSKDPPSQDDEQGDSGMVLPSEELKHLKWTSGAKSLTRENLVPCMCNDITGLHDDEPPVLPCDCDSEESCSSPPDYNSAFLYPSL